MRRSVVPALDLDYERYWRTRKPLWMIGLTLAIAFSGITPVLVVADWPEWFVAALPAVAAIILAVMTGYHWRDNIARSAVTAEALTAELARLLIRARPKYREDDVTAASEFMNQMAGLRMAEVADWRGAFLKPIDVRESTG